MAKENFILVSLDDPKTKKLAQTISNESCKKILNYLADKESTETELSEKLKIPLSTVHYNLQQLTKANLVISEEYHYSKKGKEVNHYKLANKYVIISPKSVWGLKEKLKSVLPVAIMALAGTGLIHFFSQPAKLARDAVPMAMKAVPTETAEMATFGADEAVADTLPSTLPIVADTIWQNPAIWFIIGAVSAIVLYLLVDYIRTKLSKDKT